MNNAYQVLLEQLPYLQKLPGNDVAYVLRDVVSEETVAGGQILFDRDDPIEHLYLVLEGEVEEMQVTRSNGRMNYRLRRTVGPRTIVGLYDLFFNQRHSTRAHALGTARLLKLQQPPLTG